MRRLKRVSAKEPDLTWAVRAALADILRRVFVDSESDPRVARRLLEVAAAFEAGVSVPDYRDE